MSARQTPDDAGRQRATTPPWPVVVLALAFGMLLVPATTFGGYLLVSNRSAVAAPNILTPVVQPPIVESPTAAPIADWQAMLHSTSCNVPCIGGLGCQAKPLACTSGLTCVPGAGDDRFGDNETWALHLSAVLEAAPNGSVIDPCRTREEFWVCRSGTPICVSQNDACQHAGSSAAAIPVTGAELAHDGLSLEVRLGSGSGPLVAKTETIVDLRRGGLCRGFSAKAVGGDVRRLSYFILPP